MSRIFHAWNEKVKVYEKIAYIINVICTVLIMIFAILQLTLVRVNLISVIEMLMGGLTATQGMLIWEKNKSLAMVSFVVSILSFAVAIKILWFK